MSALAAIAVLALLIFVHELGHFMAARLQGIYANRFSIGFGPILWKYQGSQTEYAIRALPLGGFVGFPDDDPDSDIPPNDPNLLRNRPIIDRAIVISAGVIANLIFAYLVLALQVGVVGIPEASQPGILIPQLIAEVSEISPAAVQSGIKPGDVIPVDGKTFEFGWNPQTSQAELLAKTSGNPIKILVSRPGKSKPVEAVITPKVKPNGKGNTGIKLVPTAAAKAGLKPGDVILSANGQSFGRSFQIEQNFRDLISDNPGKLIAITIQRGDKTLELKVTPEATPTGEGRIGVPLKFNGEQVFRHSRNVVEIFSMAADRFQQIVTLTIQGFAQLIGNFQATASQVAGPVKIVEIGAKLAQQDATSLFQFAALISINLAIINILPLPALDGGQLAFLLIEGVMGKPLPAKIQEGVMQTGLMLLLGLGIFLIVRDTANLESVQNLFR
jgi:RIP metalloprotease RseP